MIETEIQIDKVKMRQIEAALQGHSRNLGRVVYRALRDTAKHGRTLMDREVRARIVVKKKAVMARIIDLEKPSYTRWRATLGLSGRRLHIASFGSVSQKQIGVGYTIQRGRRKTIRHAFVRTMRKKAKSPEAKEETYRVVFRRTLRGEHGFGRGRPTRRGILPGRIVSRTPLIAPKGPSIGEVIKDAPAVLAKIEREGALKLSTELDRHVKVELSRRMPR